MVDRPHPGRPTARATRGRSERAQPHHRLPLERDAACPHHHRHPRTRLARHRGRALATEELLALGRGVTASGGRSRRTDPPVATPVAARRRQPDRLPGDVPLEQVSRRPPPSASSARPTRSATTSPFRRHVDSPTATSSVSAGSCPASSRSSACWPRPPTPTPSPRPTPMISALSRPSIRSCSTIPCASADRFLDDDTLPVPGQRRQHLLETLDLYGIGRCIELLNAGHAQTSQLIEQLRAHVGYRPAARRAGQRSSHGRAGVLKAHAALADLERISYRNAVGSDAGAGGRFATASSNSGRAQRCTSCARWKRPAPGRQASSPCQPRWAASSSGSRPRSTPAASSASPPTRTTPTCAAAAMERAGAWLGVVNDPRTDPPTRRAATTIHESYVIAWEHFDGT